ncbi:tyrosine kinase receptor Cad96Ca-like isoform X2 [Montipora foliosa]|uniref:tyrosine kinase receptor Cad96Ca-like isoform X2 n=1 Tax=Montipora foliosa TaxID=591990 RepID=UPI0035F16C62
MYSDLLCILMGLLLVFPETDSLTWTGQPNNPTEARKGNNVVLTWSYSLTADEQTNSQSFFVIQWFKFNLSSLAFDRIASKTFISTLAPNSLVYQEPLSPHIVIDKNHKTDSVTLHINDVKIDDEGQYKIRYVKDILGNVLAELVMNLTVLDPPSNISASSDLNITAPANLTLNCSANGKPEPTITWTRLSDNTEVTMPLHITGRKDAGDYRCTAANGVGTPLTKDVSIIVLFRPKISLPKKFYVGREQNVSLTCAVDGNPTPTISWTPCNLPNHVCDKQYLNISKVKTTRTTYICNASNYLGSDSATTVVFIGGFNIYLRLSISEECKNKDSVWETLKNELDEVFAQEQTYIEAELIDASCGSLIFVLVLKFNPEIAEDDIISTIKSAAVDGKLGELTVNTSSIIGIPPVILHVSTTRAFTTTTPESYHDSGNIWIIVGAVSAAVALVLIIAVIVWCTCVRKKKCSNETKEVSDGNEAGQGRIPMHMRQHSIGVARKKRPYKVAEDKDRRIYYNEDAMEELNPTNNPPSSSNQQRRIPIEPAYVPLQETSHYEIRPSSPNSSPQNDEYAAPLDIKTRSWEVTREDVKVEKIIGKGAFGQVAKGTAKNLPFHSDTTTVAVKMLKAKAPESDKRDLKSELELMKTLKPHPHVIKLLGCVTETDPLLVLIEYVPYGDLLGYLRKSRGLNDTYYKDPDIKPQTSLTSQQLMKFAWQIADGMSYLSLRKIIHRDLAARNVLVGETETCKVTDFGMARDVQQENIYERKTRGRLPVKWTAYESLLYGIYTTKSDVWSYGVVLYEIFTVGGSPYPRMDGKKIASLLQEGYRMPKPQHVDNDLYQIMMNCWQNEPEARPSFADLTQELKGMETQHKRLLNMHIYDNDLYAKLEDLNA